jgi:hypothetical protein
MAWTCLGKTVLSGASSTIEVSGMDAKKFLFIDAQIFEDGASNVWMRCNSDSGSNYSTRLSEGGGADVTTTGDDGLKWYQTGGGGEAERIIQTYVVNYETEYKLFIAPQIVESTATGSGTAPLRNEHCGKWSNNSDSIDTITLVNTESTNGFKANSSLAIFGSD